MESTMSMQDGHDHIFADEELQLLLDAPELFVVPDGAGLQFLPPPSVLPVQSHTSSRSFGHGAMNNMSLEESRPMSVAPNLPWAGNLPSYVPMHQLQLPMALNSSHQLQLPMPRSTGMPQMLGVGMIHGSNPPCNVPVNNLAIPAQPEAVSQNLVTAESAAAKPYISHSKVEKQRRDRINNLIDELRELVPPSTASLAAAAGGDYGANSEARRPKHVVLADTISMLKQLALKAPLSALLAAPSLILGPDLNHPGGWQHPGLMPVALEHPARAGPPVKEEIKRAVSDQSKGSHTSHEDELRSHDEGPPSGAPRLPHIPVAATSLAGVSVEQGPDCLYVQVKCRDRPGLLCDIINALKALPLEVRTAAVTTQADGLVRDVFEVCAKDDKLKLEIVQNMVHEALFEARLGKRSHA